jgi:hypothetical protein
LAARTDTVSAIGSGSTVTLPSGFTLRYGDSVLFVEAFYQFHPYMFSVGWLSPADRQVDLRSIAAYRPRFGTLTKLAP